MEHTEQINELAGALAKAQGAMSNVIADQKASIQTRAGGTYSYNYADLASILQAIRKPLSDNGLCILQGIHDGSGAIIIMTALMHASGQWVRSELAMPLPEGATPQNIGSVITYGRRYGLTALIGIAQEDDDGKAASSEQTPRPQPPKPAREIQELAKVETHSEEQQDHTMSPEIEQMNQLAALVNKRWGGLLKKERAENYAKWVGLKFGRSQGSMTPEERLIVIEALEFEIAEIKASEEPTDQE